MSRFQSFSGSCNHRMIKFGRNWQVAIQAAVYYIALSYELLIFQFWIVYEKLVFRHIIFALF